MRPMFSLIKREFAAYFLSPIAYAVLAVFLLVTGHLFFLTLNLLTESGPHGVEFPMQTMLGDEKFWLVFLFIPPLLTMRLFAEERGTGTLEMLMTAPIRDWQVVLGKFIACFLFYLVLWIPTIVYWPVLTDFQSVTFDWKHTSRSIPVLIAGGAAVLLFLVDILPPGAWFRLILLVLLTLGPAGVYIWLYDLHVVPGFLNIPPEQKGLLIGAQAGVLLAAFTCLFLLPFALLRLFGEDFDISVSLVGWLQFIIALVFVGVHLGRTQAEGVFQPLHIVTGIDPRPLVISYIGVFLAGAMFLSLGLFISSLVKSQMVAALVSLIVSLVFIVAGFWRPDMDPSSPISRLVFYISVPLHFRQDFTRGILNVGHVVLYVSLTLLFLFLTVRSLETRRWK